MLIIEEMSSLDGGGGDGEGRTCEHANGKREQGRATLALDCCGSLGPGTGDQPADQLWERVRPKKKETVATAKRRSRTRTGHASPQQD